jgi:hypothetical protein
VIVAFVPTENRTLCLRGKSWKDVRKHLPAHNLIGNLLIAEVPVVDLHEWNAAIMRRAERGALTGNAVAAKLDDGSSLWLWEEAITDLLRARKKLTLKSLRESFPYLKDAEVRRLKNYDFTQHHTLLPADMHEN